MSQSETLAQAARWLREARRVVVFTGAGVSAESGIPTFRDDSGLWQRYPPEQFACWDGLLRTALVQPRQVADFLVAVIEPIASAQPNPGHRAIAELERHVPVTVITQNVDGLHQEAGSTTVREVHGSFFEVVTLSGRFVQLLSRRDLQDIVARVRSAQAGPLKLLRLGLALRPLIRLGPTSIQRPKIVLFGEAMAEPDWSNAQRDSDECDVMLVVGTSGLVWPAAMLPIDAKRRGARIIDIDPGEAGQGDLWLRGPAAGVLPMLLQAAFG